MSEPLRLISIEPTAPRSATDAVGRPVREHRAGMGPTVERVRSCRIFATVVLAEQVVSVDALSSWSAYVLIELISADDPAEVTRACRDLRQ